MKKQGKNNKMIWKSHRCDIEGCEYKGSTDRHHILPKSQGGDNNKSNISRLCPNHHRAIHGKQIEILGWRTTSDGRVLITNQ